MAGGLGQPHVPGDHRGVHLAGEVPLDLLRYLEGQVGPLCAADTLLVPVQCEYYALEGLSDLLYTVRLAKQRLNPALELEGVVLTMYDGRTNLSLQVAEEVKRHFPGPSRVSSSREGGQSMKMKS